jgi:hypothetical protein
MNIVCDFNNNLFAHPYNLQLLSQLDDLNNEYCPQDTFPVPILVKLQWRNMSLVGLESFVSDKYMIILDL